jgi:hypothetical protein
MTDAQAPTQAPASAPRGPQGVDKGRGGPKAIQLLVPVWGTAFISQFLRVSLPTLLAPGNLPALAKALPCKLIFLTSSDDAADLRDNAAIHYLRGVCGVEFNIIDDLITGDNYSTTITLAYARVVRAAGEAMLDTCFFFMISDYVMADGSLANVLARIRDGYSGVVAGNFQVVEESAQASFFKTFDTGKPQMVIRPRDLMRWAIKHLHPMTLANMVNFPLCHSVHSNRLFWRVDDSTLLGRFYLMHMICIRPEITDFVVGSSCDYSFIPEMCPSGKVHVLTDSDDYLVVEMQKRVHERNFVRLGAVKQESVAGSLAEWATATHRKNAHSAVVFHAAALAPALDKVVAESGAYIETIEQSLPAPPPHRNHPYWLGAMAGHKWALAQKQKQVKDRPLTVTDMLEAQATGFTWWLYRFRNLVFGRPPQVKPWHPRWPDYRMFMDFARRHFSGVAGQLLIISSAPAAFGNFLSDVSQSAVSVDLSRFLNLNHEQFQQLVGSSEGCLLVLGEAHIHRAHDLIRRVKALLPRDRTLLLFAINGQGAELGPWFSGDMLHDVGQFFDHDMPIDEIAFVPAGLVPWIALRGMQNAFALVQKNWLWMWVESFVVCALTIVSFVCNLGRRGSADAPRNQICSSVAMVMHKAVTQSIEIETIEEKPLDLPAQRFLWSWARPADENRAELPEEIAAKR